ncbi:hypothetical protein ACWKW5_20050 [Shinella zoogloeoides]
MEGALDFLTGEHMPDAAILDINLRGTMGYAVADRLLDIGLPFVFVTGYDCTSIPDRFRSVPCLTKPCEDRTLISHLAGLSCDAPQ